MLVRALGAVLLLAMAGIALAAGEPALVAAVGALGLGVQLCEIGWRTSIVSLWSAGLLAAILILLQWAGGTIGWELPLRSVALFLVLTSAVRLAPWTEILRKAKPGSRAFSAVLFLLILHHFVLVLGAETRRVLISRCFAAPCQYGPGWFRSLQRAVAAIFQRSMVRAEHFYAVQVLRGLDK